MLRFSLYLLLVFALAAPLAAKEAAPMSADPALEARVNEIAKELRCLVCQNQTIADSHAELAVDLKNQVRDMVRSGQSQDEIIDYMVQRYGDFVLYRPPVKPTTYFLWVGPFVLFFLGLTILFITIRRRRRRIVADAPLSGADAERLRALLDRPGEDSRS